MKVLFLHGWQSVPGGVKPSYLTQHGHEQAVRCEPKEEVRERMQKALRGEPLSE